MNGDGGRGIRASGTRGSSADGDPAERTTASASHWAGEPVHVLRERWSLPRVDAYDSVGSTNDRLQELAADGVSPFTLVIAEEQTAGRGRGGRSWVSPSGAGIWMSVLLPPGGASGTAPLTPILVGVAVVRAVEGFWPSMDVGLKWPNDVVVEERKLCGILCESTARGAAVAGIGINVRDRTDALPGDVRARATSLEGETSETVERVRVVGAILDELRALTDPIPDSLTGSLAAEVARLDRLRGRRLESPSGVIGRGAGIDGQGALLIDPGGGSPFERIVAGSVTLLPEVRR